MSAQFDDASFSWRLPDKYWEDFERHLEELMKQRYRSTSKTITRRMQMAGMMGDAYLKLEHLGIEPDFRNKPEGDGGADAVLRLRLPGKERPRDMWMDQDTKTTTHPSRNLLVGIDWREGEPKPRLPPYGIETYRIYVAVYSPEESSLQVSVTGWLFGHDVIARGRIIDLQKGEDNHQAWQVRPGQLRRMSQLKGWLLNAFYQDDPRLTGYNPRSEKAK